jgi:hypothetical protein
MKDLLSRCLLLGLLIVFVIGALIKSSRNNKYKKNILQMEYFHYPKKYHVEAADTEKTALMGQALQMSPNLSQTISIESEIEHLMFKDPQTDRGFLPGDIPFACNPTIEGDCTFG